MNILLLNWRDPHNPRAGGAEYVTLEHAKAWIRGGDAVIWFSSSFAGAKDEEVIDGVKIIRRGNMFTVFAHAVWYYAFHRHKIDIIIDQVHGIPFFTALYARKPMVLFLHEIAGTIWDVMYPRPVSWVGKGLERLYLFLYRHHMIWTDAPSTAQELVRFGVTPSHCRAIPCPILHRPLAKRPKKNTKPTFVFVGRLVRMKRVEDTLASFADIVQSLPTAVLWIIGEGNPAYLALLKRLARRLRIADRVTWFGKVSEKKKMKLLSQSHLLLHTSLKEGWGLVVLEAASQWTPSVVYGVVGLVDTVKDGETGIIVRTCHPHDLAQAAISLYTDDSSYRYMQKQAAAWSGSFRWEDVTKTSRALLQEVYETYR